MFIHARNVNHAYRQAIKYFKRMEESPEAWQPSRAGKVMAFSGPVVTEYTHPWERVLWDSHRDCNPFFHLFESLWMLAGREDVEYLKQFNGKIDSFSDDGETFNGAYGHRWRQHFGYDQLEEIIRILADDPNSRRCMLTMWSPTDLTYTTSKDLPCNVMVKFENKKGFLEMQVFNRSNDMIWGAYGANAVHMAFLQEYVAACLGIGMGKYWQISGNFHVYEETWRSKVRADGYTDAVEPVTSVMALGMSHIPNRGMLHDQIVAFVAGRENYQSNRFLAGVCKPLHDVWRTWKEGKKQGAFDRLNKIEHQEVDWVRAGREWMARRMAP